MEVPKNGWLLMEHAIKIDDLGGMKISGNHHMQIVAYSIVCKNTKCIPVQYIASLRVISTLYSNYYMTDVISAVFFAAELQHATTRDSKGRLLSKERSPTR